MTNENHGETDMPAPGEAASDPPLPPSPAEVERRFLDAERRARRYWYEDGLGEIAVGGFFVILGVYFTTQRLITGRLGPTADVLLNLLFPVIVIGAGLGMRRVIGKAKERLVYPRAGYVAYPQKQRVPKWLTGMIAGAVAGLVAVLARSAPGVEAWLSAFQGFMIGGFLWWLGRLSGLARFSLLGLVTALIGVLLSLAGGSSTVSGALFFGAVGLALMVSGWTAFRHFVRANGAGE